ncbi:putative gustatory receptor 2a [Bacillus rossius redtenbacheri]|uniref:putative gustatory receptor 2a n=1 Tax=Bacillus rossius redtenbacheri TaxID=93214 RepID=UPI002FDDF45D
MARLSLNPKDLESSLWPVRVLLAAAGLLPAGGAAHALYNAAVALAVAATGATHLIVSLRQVQTLLNIWYGVGTAAVYCSVSGYFYNNLFRKEESRRQVLARLVEADRALVTHLQGSHRRATILQLVLIACFSATTIALTYYAYVNVWYGQPTVIFFWVLACVPLIISLIVTTNLITVVIVLSQRFKAINVSMSEMLEYASDNLAASPVFRSNSDSVRLTGTYWSTGVCSLQLKIIQLMELHGKLSDIVESINSLYGLPIMLDVIATFISIVTSLYYSFPRGVDGYQHDLQFHTSVASVTRSLLHFSKLALLISSCELATYEASKTVKLVQKLKLLSIIDADTRNTARVLIIDATLPLVKFSGFGFFSLDFHFLGAFVSAVTTYLVIIFQFG